MIPFGWGLQWENESAYLKVKDYLVAAKNMKRDSLDVLPLAEKYVY